jgi:hypothetical protein
MSNAMRMSLVETAGVFAESGILKGFALAIG